MSLTDRNWTQFAIDAEVDSFGVSRIVAVHNDLRTELEALKAERDKLRGALRTIYDECDDPRGWEVAGRALHEIVDAAALPEPTT